MRKRFVESWDKFLDNPFKVDDECLKEDFARSVLSLVGSVRVLVAVPLLHCCLSVHQSFDQIPEQCSDPSLGYDAVTDCLLFCPIPIVAAWIHICTH